MMSYNAFLAECYSDPEGLATSFEKIEKLTKKFQEQIEKILSRTEGREYKYEDPGLV